MSHPGPVISLLEQRKDDAGDYISRSVAINLNAISKDNPEQALNISRAWLDEPSKKKNGLSAMPPGALLKPGIRK